MLTASLPTSPLPSTPPLAAALPQAGSPFAPLPAPDAPRALDPCVAGELPHDADDASATACATALGGSVTHADDSHKAAPWAPSPRDAGVYRAVVTEGCSTREAASQFGISQTRVRQIVRRVIAWLTEVLPSEAQPLEPEQALRIAQSIAADRLDYLYRAAMGQWRGTQEPKFASLALRVAVARGRLPVALSITDSLLAEPLDESPAPSHCESAAMPPAPPSAPSLRDCSPVGGPTRASSFKPSSEVFDKRLNYDTNVDCYSTYETLAAPAAAVASKSLADEAPLLTAAKQPERTPTEVLTADDAEAVLRRVFRGARRPRRAK